MRIRERLAEIDSSIFESGQLLIRKHLSVERDLELDEFVELYARALWYEKREIDLIAAAVAKAFQTKE